MDFNRAVVASSLLLAVGGCNPMADNAPAPPRSAPTEVRRPANPGPEDRPSPVRSSPVEVSWDTNRDRTYAEFLRDHSAGMIKAAAVGVERKGTLNVKLDKSVAPDDTLELTKSLMAGARKDFPDQPIALKVFDPAGEAILTARFRPGEGVKYQIAHEGAARTEPAESSLPRPADRSASVPTPPPASADPSSRSGVTENDRRFASWAEEHGKSYLRYVEADLEKHGRLWFGVTREVKPGDVKDLTRSLLEGAQKEFPRRDLVATVFDPQGERIGRAHLGSDGSVRWEK